MEDAKKIHIKHVGKAREKVKPENAKKKTTPIRMVSGTGEKT